jgi:hypothetical protein
VKALDELRFKFGEEKNEKISDCGL